MAIDKEIPIDFGAAALAKIIDSAGNLADVIGKFDARLKKLEQGVKKR